MDSNSIQNQKNLHGFLSKTQENSNPNTDHPTPVKSTTSPLTKSAKSAMKNQNQNQNLDIRPNPVVFSPRNKIRERRFVIAKKNSRKEKQGPVEAVNCKCEARLNGRKCLCAAYETLKASQDEFFKKRSDGDEKKEEPNCAGENICGEAEIEVDESGKDPIEIVKSDETINFVIKRKRGKELEETRSSAAEPGTVSNLVKEFEKLVRIPKSNETESDEETEKTEENDTNRAIINWSFGGFNETEKDKEPLSSFCPSDFFMTVENLGLDHQHPSVSSSWNGTRGSNGSRTSNGSRRSRRDSSGSSMTMGGSRWKKKQQLKTCPKPFRLRTEQRGRMKEEEFMKKIQEMMEQEEKLRIPLAQGLPLTTDEPECLIKPPVKESTMPADLKLHTDIRAVERSEFDQQIAEKMSTIEQYKMERERRQKLEEEEEIRRLRKELVPKAQPMPYFDRPFIPRRSAKNPTIPKEPRFHIPQHKKIKCCESWRDNAASCTEH